MNCLFYFRPLLFFFFTDSKNPGPGLSESEDKKKIREPKYIGVRNRLHPQKLPFLQILELPCPELSPQYFNV